MHKKNTLQKLRDIKFRLYYISIFKLKTFIRRKLGSVLRFNRPASLPFITGDGFRALAEHVFDELSDIKCSSVSHGDIVFVRADLLQTYFKKVHPHIKNPYILISHNSDQNITADYEKYVDTNIIHWFAQNVLVRHPKITPIPIGLQLRMYDVKNKIVELLKLHQNNTEKNLKIFYSFSEETNTKRSIALTFLQKSEVCSGSVTMLARNEYYLNISRHAFNASPEGGGLDCHRTWESMHLRAIPVLERNVTTEHWYNIGLPVLLIDSWKEIDTISESFLQEQYLKLKDKFNSPALYMEYWINEIMKHKNAK